MTAPSDALVRAGSLLADKYRVERVLGSGGMGVVVAARHLELGELHAIKYMLPETRGLEEASARFMREGRAAARLKSAHTVRVFDVGRFASGEPYMVMEYLDGHDLKEELRQRGPLPVAEVADFVLQACEALVEAHAMGIIHRDLKPSNLFLTRSNDGSPCVKVLDFGISKLVGALAEHDSDLTQTAALLGTPAYMSPEQMAEARDIDGRTDVWSLGIILYELLSGAKPFVGRSIPAITMAVASQSVPPLRARRPDVSIELETVVLRCLNKDRDARYPDIQSFARALAPFAVAGGEAIIERIARVQRVSIPEAPPSARWRPAPPIEPPTRVVPLPGYAPPTPPAPISYTAASWGADAPAAARRHLPVIVIAAALTLGAIGAIAIWAAQDGVAEDKQPAAADAPSVEDESAAASAAASTETAAPAASSGPATPSGAPARPAPPRNTARPKRDPFGEGWR